MTPTQNPFLTPTVYQACVQARVSYLDTLARMQQFGGTATSELETQLAQRHSNLDQYREEALRAAERDDIQGASVQLASIVMEWGVYKALDDLINANGQYLDPADVDRYNDIEQAIQHKVVLWATELKNSWIDGNNQRAKDVHTLSVERHAELNEAFHRVLQEQQTSLAQAHQHNQLYADTALKGIQQAQQGVQWMQQGTMSLFSYGAQVIHHTAEVNRGLAETQKAYAHTIAQNTPQGWVEAQRKLEVGRLLTRGGCVVIFLLGIPTAFLLAYVVLNVMVRP